MFYCIDIFRVSLKKPFRMVNDVPSSFVTSGLHQKIFVRGFRNRPMRLNDATYCKRMNWLNAGMLKIEVSLVMEYQIGLIAALQKIDECTGDNKGGAGNSSKKTTAEIYAWPD